MFQQLNPFATTSAAAAAVVGSEEKKRDSNENGNENNTSESNESRTQRALKAFLAASHTDAELVKIVSQLQATAFRQPSEIDGTYRRRRPEEPQSVAHDGHSDSATLPVKSRVGAHANASPGARSNDSDACEHDDDDDDDDVFGMEDGGVVVDEYVGEVLRSRAQSALSTGSFGSNPRQRLASWDEFGSEAADIGLAAQLVSSATGDDLGDGDGVAENSDSRGLGGDDDRGGRGDGVPRRHDADGPILDADGAGADEADNAFAHDATDAFAIGGASDEEDNVRQRQ